MSKPACDWCGEPAPYGDERNQWLGYHQSWWHKSYWKLKKRLSKDI